MKMELRLCNIEKLDTWLNSEFDIISIGDEYCPWKLLSIENVKGVVEKIIASGKELIIVTSFVASAAFEKIINIIKDAKAVSDKIKYVINDYGLLVYLKDNKILSKNIIVGQMLNHSLEEYLWSEDVVKEETKKVKNNWLMSNYSSSRVIDFFMREFNIEGVIFNKLPYNQEGARIAKRCGCSIYFMDKYYTMAVARKCHAAKYNNLCPGHGCDKLCNKPLLGSLEKIYTIDNMSQKFVIPTEDVLEKTKNWIIFGNAVYKEYPYPLILKYSDYTDDMVIIMSQKYYDNDIEINMVVSSYKEGGIICN